MGDIHKDFKTRDSGRHVLRLTAATYLGCSLLGEYTQLFQNYGSRPLGILVDGRGTLTFTHDGDAEEDESNDNDRNDDHEADDYDDEDGWNDDDEDEDDDD